LQHVGVMTGFAVEGRWRHPGISIDAFARREIAHLEPRVSAVLFGEGVTGVRSGDSH